MSATLRTYMAMIYTRPDGTLTALGTLQEPLAEQALAGLEVIGPRRIVVPAGESKVLWDYTQQLAFGMLVVRIVGDGYLFGAYHTDTCEDLAGGDFNPSGDYPRAREFDLSCEVPFILNTNKVRVNPVVADEYTITGGFPVIFTDAGTVEGRVYKMTAHNGGTEDVTVEIAVFN